MSLLTPILDPAWPSIGGAGPPDEAGTFPTNLSTAPGSLTIDLLESIGWNASTSGPISEIAVGHIHLLAADAHSTEDRTGYGIAALQGTANPTRSYERWIRFRFNPPFNTVRAFRFVATGFVAPTGWSLNFGSATTYSAPTNAASAIATSPVPTSDPGPGSPNCGGAHRLAGTGVQYSDWVVLQAVVNPGTANVGPILGFTTEGTLLEVTYAFHWIES